jgi:hypothetical protein
VFGVWRTMAWVACALWRGGRWCEVRVFQGTRDVVGVHARCKYAIGTAVGWVHGVWDAGAAGRG